jgi:hypothetical protein
MKKAVWGLGKRNYDTTHLIVWLPPVHLTTIYATPVGVRLSVHRNDTLSPSATLTPDGVHDVDAGVIVFPLGTAIAMDTPWSPLPNLRVTFAVFPMMKDSCGTSCICGALTVAAVPLNMFHITKATTTTNTVAMIAHIMFSMPLNFLFSSLLSVVLLIF